MLSKYEPKITTRIPTNLTHEKLDLNKKIDKIVIKIKEVDWSVIA